MNVGCLPNRVDVNIVPYPIAVDIILEVVQLCCLGLGQRTNVKQSGVAQRTNVVKYGQTKQPEQRFQEYMSRSTSILGKLGMSEWILRVGDGAALVVPLAGQGPQTCQCMLELLLQSILGHVAVFAPPDVPIGPVALL